MSSIGYKTAAKPDAKAPQDRFAHQMRQNNSLLKKQSGEVVENNRSWQKQTENKPETKRAMLLKIMEREKKSREQNANALGAGMPSRFPAEFPCSGYAAQLSRRMGKPVAAWKWASKLRDAGPLPFLH